MMTIVMVLSPVVSRLLGKNLESSFGNAHCSKCWISQNPFKHHHLIFENLGTENRKNLFAFAQTKKNGNLIQIFPPVPMPLSMNEEWMALPDQKWTWEKRKSCPKAIQERKSGLQFLWGLIRSNCEWMNEWTNVGVNGCQSKAREHQAKSIFQYENLIFCFSMKPSWIQFHSPTIWKRHQLCPQTLMDKLGLATGKNLVRFHATSGWNRKKINSKLIKVPVKF